MLENLGSQGSDSKSSPSGKSGVVQIGSGSSSSYESGDVFIRRCCVKVVTYLTGAFGSDKGGTIVLSTGSSNAVGTSGAISVVSGSAGNSGVVVISSGSGDAGTAGSISITAGASKAGAGASISTVGGNSAVKAGGSILTSAGASWRSRRQQLKFLGQGGGAVGGALRPHLWRKRPLHQVHKHGV